MKTIAVIPSFNEYQQIQKVVDAALTYVDAVVVVDDGSKHPLPDHLTTNTRLTVLRHEINLGKGAAMKTGVQFALNKHFEVVVFLDADGQHRPEEIPRLLEPIQANRADIVFGVRHFHHRMPLVAKMGNIFLSVMLGLLFRVRVSDTQSGFRAFRLAAYPQLAWESPRYAVETEMIVNVGKHHLRFAEVPIETIYLDKYKGTTVIDGIRIFLNMITWRIL